MSDETRDLEDPSWIGRVTTPTGVREVTELGAIDAGFGRWLINIFQGMTITDVDNPKNKGAISFFNREPDKQVYMGSEDEPDAFLKRLRASKQGRQGDDSTIKDAMPLVYFKRRVDTSMEDTGAFVKTEGELRLFQVDDNGNEIVIANINQSFLTLNYQVYIMAWDLPTISRLTTSLTAHLNHQHRTQHAYTVKTMILGVPIELSGIIQYPRSLTFEDASLQQDEGRILAVQCDIQVIGQVLEAIAVDEQLVNWRFKDLPPIK